MSNLETTPRPSPSDEGASCADSPVVERIQARSGEIGQGLVIRRALPARRRRLVGAWCFLDHAGPLAYGPGEGLNVGPHPHIGLQTFTWMIDGEVLHRDSLGYEQLVRPGEVNLMTAGRGIAHTEEEPGPEAGRIHAAQLWIALPDSERHREPAFQHCVDLPKIHAGGFDVTVLAGSAYGQTAPTVVYSPLVGIDLTSSGAAATSVPLQAGFEHAVLCLEGAARIAGEPLEPGTLLYLGLGRERLEVETGDAARLLLIGGEPFAEEVLLWWNFVARDAAEIEQATADWNAGRHFAEVPGTRLARLVAPDIGTLRLRASRD